MTGRRFALGVAAALMAAAMSSSTAVAAPAAGVVKVLARDGAGGAERDLRARNAVRSVVDYGSYRLLLVDEQAAGGRAALRARGLEVRDDMSLVRFGRNEVDTRRPADAEARLSGWQQRRELARAKSERRAPRDGLYVVQFVGPVRPAWLTGLTDAGLEIVSYVPENAYVVRARGGARKRLQDLEAASAHVDYVGDFHPGYRVADDLLAAADSTAGGVIDVVVQVIDGPQAKTDLAELRGLAADWYGEHRVLNFRNAELALDASKLRQVAAKEYVFHIERRVERRRLDEAQGQILAGNLTGNAPSGPGYLSWLTSKGFSSTQFGGFAVNVVDDAYALSGHPDLPNNRIAFANNPTNQTGAQGGHGFLNSHIIGGFNTGTGSAFEDASGYNYGLGIAPYSKVGVTAIFGNGNATPTAWESTAYGQGARVSSNSWGYTGAGARKYDANSQEYDRIVRDAQTGAGSQPLSVVFAAANDGPGTNTVSSPGTAKNVITVGAGENVRQTGSDGCAVDNTGANSANDIIDFSSRGPVNSSGGDGRTKPDIMAPGTHIEAGVPQSNYDGSSVCNKYWPTGQTLYGWSSGTSHSTPAVAGGAALVYQDFLNKGRPAPSPAMVKAYLMNSATHMTGVGANDTLPSNNQGMGRMNLGRAFDAAPRVLVDQSELLGSSGQAYTSSGSVAAGGGLRVTLAWSDAAGPTTGAPWVNNLDLEVTSGGVTYKGNVFSGANSVSGGSADGKNNVESVFLPAASGGYTVTVRGTNIAGDGVPGNADTTDQDFALVIGNGSVTAPTEPSIGASPTSLSFAASAGGANPASQNLTITNTGAGTLNWSATDNQPWLTVSPASGTAPSTSTISVDTAGLAAGSYGATITLTAAGATNSPLTVPVTLTVTPAAPADELLVNGGFEGSSSPWALAGSAFWTGSGGFPHGGTGHAFLGTANSASGSVSQTVTIPSNAAAADLSFWLNVSSAETTGSVQYDKLFVEVTNAAGTVLATPATYSNLNKAADGVYTQRGAFSLDAYRGQTVRVQFRATTDSSLITTFRIDDVSLRTGGTGNPPVIGVSPTSMSFSGVAGGASPAGQSLAISNTGGGVLSWSATDDQPWLSVSPASGTAPSSATVSVNTAGLAAGTYNATITITATGATNSPRTVPVTLTVTPGTAAELITNGGFEGSVNPWVLSGAGAFWIGNGASPHGGTGYGYLGVNNSTSGQFYETISIPSTATTANLTFWLNVTSSETTTSVQYDKLFVEVRNTAGTLLATPATFSNLNKAATGVYTQRGAYSLLAYRGQTVRVQFRTTTDVSLPTTFRVDDVSVK